MTGKQEAPKALSSRRPACPLGPWGMGLYLGDDLWGGDNVTDEGSSGLGRTVSDGACTVQHKVLFYPSCQVLVPARLPGRKEGLIRDRQPGHHLDIHPSTAFRKARNGGSWAYLTADPAFQTILVFWDKARL